MFLRNSLYFIIAIGLLAVMIAGIVNGSDSDKFMVILSVELILAVLLIFTIYSGLNAVKGDTSHWSYYTFLILATLIMYAPALVLYRSLTGLAPIVSGIISIIVLAVWAANMVSILMARRSKG